MKLWKNFASLFFVAVLVVFICSGCTKTTVTENGADSYSITATDDVLAPVQDNSDYAVTFIDLGGKTTADLDTIKKALSDPSQHSTVEGKASKAESGKLKLTNAGGATIDLKHPYASFWGLSSKKIGDFLSGAAAGETSCGICSGVDNFKEVHCTDPNSVICCVNCH